jgi:hypothetical protein
MWIYHGETDAIWYTYLQTADLRKIAIPSGGGIELRKVVAGDQHGIYLHAVRAGI